MSKTSGFPVSFLKSFFVSNSDLFAAFNLDHLLVLDRQRDGAVFDTVKVLKHERFNLVGQFGIFILSLHIACLPDKLKKLFHKRNSTDCKVPLGAQTQKRAKPITMT